MNRVCIFIDGSQFYLGLKRNNHSTRVDYFELSKGLTGPDRKLVRTYYFNSAYDPLKSPEQSKSQQSFLNALARTPFLEMKLGRLLPLKEGGFGEKGTDIRFVSNLVYYAARDFFDTAIVVTEDPDYADALKRIGELGRIVEVALFSDNRPEALENAADRIVSLEDVFVKFGHGIFKEIPEENIGNRTSDLHSYEQPTLISVRKIFKKNAENQGQTLFASSARRKT